MAHSVSGRSFVKIAIVVATVLTCRSLNADASTIVTPVLDHPIDREHNLVYCSTFQMAWNEMTWDIVKERIVLDGQPDLADKLNSRLEAKDGLGSSGSIVMSGYGRDGVADRINEVLSSRFGGRMPLVDPSFNDKDVILAYACLDKESRFSSPFSDFNRPLMFGVKDGEMPVRAFGSGHGSGRDDVEILEYSRGGEFVVRIGTGDPGEELILASVQPEETLLKTCRLVQHRVAKAAPEELGQLDVMIVPVLDIGAGTSFSPLMGRFLLNEGFTEYFVAEARQDIRFRMDNRGVTIRSEGVFALKKGRSGGKSLIFRNPFLLYLRRKDDEHPYFAIWVGNAELMENVRS